MLEAKIEVNNVQEVGVLSNDGQCVVSEAHRYLGQYLEEFLNDKHQNTISLTITKVTR